MEIVKLLLEQEGIDINAKDWACCDKTALIYTCDRGHRNIAILLFEQKAIDKNAKDVNGKTALNYATKNKNSQIVYLLKEEDTCISKNYRPIINKSSEDCWGVINVNNQSTGCGTWKAGNSFGKLGSRVWGSTNAQTSLYGWAASTTPSTQHPMNSWASGSTFGSNKGRPPSGGGGWGNSQWGNCWSFGFSQQK